MSKKVVKNVGFSLIVVLAIIILVMSIRLGSSEHKYTESDASTVVESKVLQEDSRSDRAIQSIEGGISPTLYASKVYGIRDVLDVILLVVVVAVIFVSWVVSYIRDKKDPLKQWEKRL